MPGFMCVRICVASLTHTHTHTLPVHSLSLSHIRHTRTHSHMHTYTHFLFLSLSHTSLYHLSLSISLSVSLSLSHIHNYITTVCSLFVFLSVSFFSLPPYFILLAKPLLFISPSSSICHTRYMYTRGNIKLKKCAEKCQISD